MEYEILKNFDFYKYDVTVFNIEKSGDEVRQLLLNNSYELVGETYSNWILIKKGIVKETI